MILQLNLLDGFEFGFQQTHEGGKRDFLPFWRAWCRRTGSLYLQAAAAPDLQTAIDRAHQAVLKGERVPAQSRFSYLNLKL